MKLIILSRQKLYEFLFLLDELVVPLLNALDVLRLLPLLLIHCPFPFLELLAIVCFLPGHMLKVLFESKVLLGLHGAVCL